MRSIRRTGRLAAAAAVAGVSTLFFVAAPAYAVPFQNGSFETPLVTSQSGFTTYCNGSTGLTGWVVGPNTCVQQTRIWPTYDGNQDIDLGTTVGNGIISQTFDTTPNTPYVLTFAYGANPGCDTAAKTFNVTVTGAPGANQNFSRTSSGVLNQPNYTTGGVTFTSGAGATSTVTFTATLPSANACGPVIDDVRLLVDPNGSILSWKVGLGIGGLVAGAYALYRMRRRPGLATA